jgi:phenylacetate-CoA ligase
MRRIDRISGRSDDMLIIRGVNVFPSNIEAVLANEDRLAPHYLLELRRPGSLDELDVVVETRSSLAGKLNGADITDLEQHAEHLIKSFVGITTKVRVVEPGTLERSQGKAKRVFDLRPKD